MANLARAARRGARPDFARALAAAVTIGPERDHAPGCRARLHPNRRRRIAVAAHLRLSDAIQAINELSTLLCKLSQYAMGDEALRSGDGAVRVICPSPSFEQYLDLACGEIRRRGAGETMISRPSSACCARSAAS